MSIASRSIRWIGSPRLGNLVMINDPLILEKLLFGSSVLENLSLIRYFERYNPKSSGDFACEVYSKLGRILKYDIAYIVFRFHSLAPCHDYYNPLHRPIQSEKFHFWSLLF